MAQSTFVLPSEYVLQEYGGRQCFADYAVEEVIGSGTFGCVFAARDKETNDKCAIKVISKRKIGSKQEVEDVQNEVKIMQLLKGEPNVCQLVDVYEDKANICLVMEICTGGDLFEHINQSLIQNNAPFTEAQAAVTIRTIVSVVQQCHAESWMHRDVKPENFMYTDSSNKATLKAIDFGLSRPFEGLLCSDIVGSAFYMAPEVLKGCYSKECDIWSCGVILYVMLAGYQPFDGESENSIFQAVRTKNLDFTIAPWPTISKDARDLVKDMLSRYPANRPTAQQVLTHEWILKHAHCV